MSQQKVDYHKEQKRNRRKIMRKEKAMRRLEITVLIVVLAALVAWFSYLVYRNVQSKYAAANVKTTEMHLAGWENYTENLDAVINGEDTAEDAEAETAAESTAEEADAATEAASSSVETAVSTSEETTSASETSAEESESTNTESTNTESTADTSAE